MYKYLANRLFYSLIAIVGIVVVVFVIVRMLGDPAVLMLSHEAPLEALEAFRREHGLDRPIWEQLGKFMLDVLRGDLGRSLRHSEDVVSLLLQRLPLTMQLAGAAFVLSLVLAVPLGVLAARYRGTFRDRSLMVMAVLGQSVPDFWLGLMLMLVFGVVLKWVPISGSGSWQHLVLPAVTLSVFPLARTTRLVRSGMIEMLNQDFVRTARAKGLSDAKVVYKHALRNALIPVVTIIGLEIGSLLGGAVIVETVFAWPGMGRFLVQALNNRDFPVIQAGVLFLALSKVAVNLAVDLLYSTVDPRVRYQ